MSEQGIQAYVLFHFDSHYVFYFYNIIIFKQSEYLSACDERIEFISGFSGLNGVCVVTQEHALMWTDGRYFIQAER